MQRNKYIGEEEEDNFANKIVSTYLPYWPVYILAIILGAAVSYIYIKFQIPIYEASATLIIKDEKKGNEESKLMEFQDPISAKKIVENEVEIIQSRRLMTDVVEKLGLYAPITEKGDYTNTSGYVTFPLVVTAIYPDSIKGTLRDEKIPISYDEIKKEVILYGKERHKLNQVVKTENGKLIFQLNKNHQNLKKSVGEFYFTLVSPSDLANRILLSLKAEPASKLSSIINLTFRDQVPKRAEDILDQLINSYRQFEINEKDALAKNTLEFVQQRLNIIAKDLDSIQRKAQQYQIRAA